MPIDSAIRRSSGNVWMPGAPRAEHDCYEHDAACATRAGPAREVIFVAHSMVTKCQVKANVCLPGISVQVYSRLDAISPDTEGCLESIRN